MRHGVHGFKLGRSRSTRLALQRSLLKALIERERIVTTAGKAKFVQPVLDRCISLAKSDSVANRRELSKLLNSPKILSKLFNEIAPRYLERSSGFSTRKLLGYRRGDNTSMVEVSLVKEKSSSANDEDAKEVTSVQKQTVESKKSKSTDKKTAQTKKRTSVKKKTKDAPSNEKTSKKSTSKPKIKK